MRNPNQLTLEFIPQQEAAQAAVNSLTNTSRSCGEWWSTWKSTGEKKTDPCTGLHLTSPFLLFAFQVAIQTVSSWKCGGFHVESFTYSNGPWTDLGLEKELCFGFMAKHCQQFEAHALQWPVCPLTTAAAGETVMNAEVPEMTVEQLMCPKFYSPSYASCGSQTQWLKTAKKVSIQKYLTELGLKQSLRQNKLNIY